MLREIHKSCVLSVHKVTLPTGIISVYVVM